MSAPWDDAPPTAEVLTEGIAVALAAGDISAAAALITELDVVCPWAASEMRRAIRAALEVAKAVPS